MAPEGLFLPRRVAGAEGGSWRQGSVEDGHLLRAKRRSQEIKIPVGALPTEVEVLAPAAPGWGGHIRVSWPPRRTLLPSTGVPPKQVRQCRPLGPHLAELGTLKLRAGGGPRAPIRHWAPPGWLCTRRHRGSKTRGLREMQSDK